MWSEFGDRGQPECSQAKVGSHPQGALDPPSRELVGWRVRPGCLSRATVEREVIFSNPKVKQTVQDCARQKRESPTGKVADLVRSGPRLTPPPASPGLMSRYCPSTPLPPARGPCAHVPLACLASEGVPPLQRGVCPLIPLTCSLCPKAMHPLLPGASDLTAQHPFPCTTLGRP